MFRLTRWIWLLALPWTITVSTSGYFSGHEKQGVIRYNGHYWFMCHEDVIEGCNEFVDVMNMFYEMKTKKACHTDPCSR